MHGSTAAGTTTHTHSNTHTREGREGRQRTALPHQRARQRLTGTFLRRRVGKGAHSAWLRLKSMPVKSARPQGTKVAMKRSMGSRPSASTE